MTIMERGNTFHLRKRVPRRYQRVEERKSIWVSLHTDSESIAKTKTKALIAWQHLVEAWEARMAGDTADADRRFEAAKELAAVRDFRYGKLQNQKALLTPTCDSGASMMPQVI